MTTDFTPVTLFCWDLCGKLCLCIYFPVRSLLVNVEIALWGCTKDKCSFRLGFFLFNITLCCCLSVFH